MRSTNLYKYWQQYRNDWKPIVIAAIILQAIPFLLAAYQPERSYPYADSYEYQTIAQNLVTNRVFSQDTTEPLLPDTYRTPIYPLLIASTFILKDGHIAILVFQAILSIITALILFHFGMACGLSLRTSKFASIIISILPVSTVSWATVTTEPLFTFWMCLSLLVAWKYSQSLISSLILGVLAGLLVLTRPIGVLVLPCLLLGLIWGKNLLARATILQLVTATLGFALVLTPWWYRGIQLFDHPYLSTVGNVNLLTYNGAALLAHRAGLGFWEGRYLVWEYWDQYEQSLATKSTNPIEIARNMKDAAILIFLENPLESIFINGIESLNGLRPGASQLMLFFQPNAFEGTTIPSDADISPIVQILKNPAALILTISVSLIYLVVYCLLATGTILLFIQRRWKIIVAVLLPIILLLYFPGPVSNSRFRIPTEPLMSIVVALALTETSLLRHKSPSDPPNQ